MWQDYALAAVQLSFLVSLAPALYRRAYPPRSTCLSTGLGLLALAGILLTLGAVFATIVNLTTGAIWLYMALTPRR
jgi:hypothetical protein